MPMGLSRDEYKALEKFIGKRATTFAEHEVLLADEISKGAKQTAFHTISRHGYQTGWEAQLVRLMTGETPDQPFALTGVRAQIQEWEKSTGGTGSVPAPTRNIRYAPADSVGAFLGPEVETLALTKAQSISRHLQGGRLAEMETGHARTRKWEKYKYIECIVSAGAQYAGVSFVRDKTETKRTKEEFEEAMEDYLAGARVLWGPTVSLHDQMTYREIRKKRGEFPAKLAEKMVKVRFPNLSDLLAYLHVEAVMMKNVRVVLKRVPDNSLTWKVHTAYAVNDPVQLRPDAPGKWVGNIKTTEFDGPRKLSMMSY